VVELVADSARIAIADTAIKVRLVVGIYSPFFDHPTSAFR
jgi:hypothetical protein